MDKNEKDLLIKQNEQFRKAYDRYGDRLLSIIPDDRLKRSAVETGAGLFQTVMYAASVMTAKSGVMIPIHSAPNAGRSLSEAVLEKIFQMNTISTHLYSDCCPAYRPCYEPVLSTRK